MKIYNEQVSKGKKTVLLIIVTILMYYLISFLSNMAIGDKQMLVKQILAFIVIVIISILFYKGFKFAGWILLAFSVQPVLTCVFSIFKLIGILELYDGWFMLISTIIIAILGAILVLRTKSIPAFMAYQRENRKVLYCKRK